MEYFRKAFDYILAYKTRSSIIFLVLAAFSYWGITSMTAGNTTPSYVLQNVERGTIVSSITGSGQVSASNQIDLKPKGSGDVTYVGVTDGQTVKAGTLVVEIDPTDAEKAVRDAQANLQSAQIALAKLKQPADNLSLIQAQNALVQSQADLDKAHSDGINSISNTFLDLPPIMAGLQDILYGTKLASGGQDNISAYADLVKNYDDRATLFRDDAAAKYKTARANYDKAFADYKTSTRYADASTTEALVNETYDATKSVAESVKSANDLLNFVKDRLTEHNSAIPSLLTTHQTSLQTYTSQTNSHLTDLLNIKNTTITSEESIAEKSASLEKLQSGADPLDIQSSELTVTQRQNALVDAQNALADYYVRVPFDGTVAKVNVKKFDTASSGTAVATLITRQKVAELSMNEVDAAKIKFGDQVTLTFDAIDGLEMTGKVAQIDTIGTVSQGVVTYTVKIAFDTDDDRIKAGMSVSAAIITDVKQDVLMVPNSAIKTSGNNTYVELFKPALADASSTTGVPSTIPPQQQAIQTGISNDSYTEVMSGLTEGQQIVTRTITATKTTTTSSAPSLLGGTGNRGFGGGGGAVRVQTTTGR